MVDGSKLRGGSAKTCGCRMLGLKPKPSPPLPRLYPARIDEATYVRAGLRLLGPDARRRAQQVRLKPDDLRSGSRSGIAIGHALIHCSARGAEQSVPQIAGPHQ